MNQFWAWLLAGLIALIGILVGGVTGFIILTVALGITGAAWVKTRAGPNKNVI